MSEMEGSSGKGKSRHSGGPPPSHGLHQGQPLSEPDFVSFQQQQDFNSWRNPPPPPTQQDYNNFYYSGASGYSPFSPGDIRDSIAAIWSRTSPSGEGVPMGGAYGQFPPPPDGQYNHLSHFPGAATDMSGLFGPAAPEYGGYPFGYGYTQWPDNTNGNRSANNGNSATGYSYLGTGGNPPHPGNEDPRSSLKNNNNNDASAAAAAAAAAALLVSQKMESLKIQKAKIMESSNGYGNNGAMIPTKKMSWAKVASQPAKPTVSSGKTKKPGVLSPPAIMPMSPPSSSSKGAQPSNSNVVSNNASALEPIPSSGVSVQNQVANCNEPSSNNSSGSKQVNSRQPMANHGPRGHRGSAKENNSSLSSSNGPRAGNSVSSSSGGSHPVLESLRSLNDYNPKNFDLSPKNARYFVLKSFCEDDIHRSIKFEIWCSTQHGNKRLDDAWNEQLGVGPVYLYFSVNGSGHFCGMAQMLTGVDPTSTNSVWVQDKFKGRFKVRWIYVKDVPNTQLRHILLENNENKPVTKSRDAQEVPSEKGEMLLKIMHEYKHSTSIFDDFAHYEKRQEAEESKKNERQQHQNSHSHHHNNHHHHHHHHHHNQQEKNHESNSRGPRNKTPWNNESAEIVISPPRNDKGMKK